MQHFTRKPRAPSLECGPVVPDTLPSDELPQSKEDFPSKSTASEKDPGLKNETMKSMLADVSTPKIRFSSVKGVSVPRPV